MPVKRNKLYIAVITFILIFKSTLLTAAITIEVSSSETGLKAEYMLDNDRTTRWGSEFSDSQWIKFDLGTEMDLTGLILDWEAAYGKEYEILVSVDNKNWSDVYSTVRGAGGIEDMDFDKTTARYLRIKGIKRGTNWGYSLFEVTLKTAEHPFGIGRAEPDVILKKNWYVDDGPKQIYIPESWASENVVLWISDIHNTLRRYSLLINDRPVIIHRKTVQNKSKLDIRDYIVPGQMNVFQVKPAASADDKEFKIRALLTARNQHSLDEQIRRWTTEGPQKYYGIISQLEPEGYFPYWLNNKQGFWTLAGLDGDNKESIISEDGTIEPYKSFSIMPFLYLDGKLLTRDDVELTQSLARDHLPIPTASWTHDKIAMDITVVTAGKKGRAVNYIRYSLRNTTDKPLTGKLFLAFRPFEINPPWHWGGWNSITDVKYSDSHLDINEYRIIFLTKPQGVGVKNLRETDIIYDLEQSRLPDKKNTRDPQGFATGAIEYQFDLEPNAGKSYFIALPLYRKYNIDIKKKDPSEVERAYNRLRDESVSYWKKRLDRVRIDIPDQDIVNTLKTNLAYIFINRDGPAIQPGSRAYEAAWIRDGAVTSAALLRMGYKREIKEYIEWYSKYLYEDGRVPAIVIGNRNEINPVKEYDSQGELIYLLLKYYKYTGDMKFLKRKFHIVEKSLQYLGYLRGLRLKDEYIGGPFYGILPNSVSHEGYYPEPGKHSYWDNFWALKGYKDARTMAGILGNEKLIERINGEEQELRESVSDSINSTIVEKEIEYIPGCAELGDFDPTSTSIAINECGETAILPEKYLKNTYDIYYNDHLSKRLKPGWTGSYSSYEIRNAQAFFRMGQKKRGLELFRHFLNCRRPKGWKQWAEDTYFPRRSPGYIGDMPHTWVGSGYINTVRTMFVYEKNGSLVLGAGIDDQWLLEEKGISITDLPTEYGLISYNAAYNARTLNIKVTGTAEPEKGFTFILPFSNSDISGISINGNSLKGPFKRYMSFKKLPAEIKVDY